MQKIQLIRIDERLVHGQVTVAWLKHFNKNEVFILDDSAFQNLIANTVMRVALPKDVKLSIYSVKEGIELIAGGKADCKDAMILIKDMQALKSVIDSGIEVDMINIARLPFKIGANQIGDSFFLTDDDKEVLLSALDKNINVFVQGVPDGNIVYIKDLLK